MELEDLYWFHKSYLKGPLHTTHETAKMFLKKML